MQWLIMSGLCLSIMAIIIQQKPKDQKAWCDINSKITCRAVLQSEYSALLKIPNSVVGVVFYTILAVAYIQSWPLFVSIFISVGVVGSLFLAWILFWKIQKICVICLSIYVINIAMGVWWFMF